MQIEYLHIGELKEAAYNPRKISKVMMTSLKKSLLEFGFISPVVVRDHDKMIIGGHQRVAAAKELINEGHTEFNRVPAYFVRASDDVAKRMNLALNKIDGEWEGDKLKSIIKELSVETFDYETIGFDIDEVKILLQEPPTLPEEDVDISNYKESEPTKFLFKVEGNDVQEVWDALKACGYVKKIDMNKAFLNMVRLVIARNDEFVAKEQQEDKRGWDDRRIKGDQIMRYCDDGYDDGAST